MDNFEERRSGRAGRQEPDDEVPPDDLIPVVRFFAGRFSREHLTPGERLVRVEVWRGRAPIQPRGVPGDNEEREQLLERYYAGSLRRPAPVSTSVQGGVEKEADITWTLAYIEDRDQP